jgi:Kdo2-lipid IVA lauroyltransferase/acyltransferase
MAAFWFYLLYPFICLIASLPFGILYKLSDFLYLMLRFSGYRKEVVFTNLKNAFPEKNNTEIERIAESYFRYLCDLILETLKTLQMSEKENRQHCIFHQTDWLEKLFENKQSILIVMGHYGNWEWAGPCFTLNTRFQLVVIYRPLSNIFFEKMMCRMRTKFGTKITPVNNTLRDMVANRGTVTATAFIADQTASPENAYWTTFLHQDTAVFTGPEKLARKFNYPVVFMNVKRTRRGCYEVFPELLSENSKETRENEILEIFTKRLEKEIIINPSVWLWSHKRWKHRKPTTSP